MYFYSNSVLVWRTRCIIKLANSLHRHRYDLAHSNSLYLNHSYLWQTLNVLLCTFRCENLACGDNSKTAWRIFMKLKLQIYIGIFYIYLDFQKNPRVRKIAAILDFRFCLASYLCICHIFFSKASSSIKSYFY